MPFPIYFRISTCRFCDVKAWGWHSQQNRLYHAHTSHAFTTLLSLFTTMKKDFKADTYISANELYCTIQPAEEAIQCVPRKWNNFITLVNLSPIRVVLSVT